MVDPFGFRFLAWAEPGEIFVPPGGDWRDGLPALPVQYRGQKEVRWRFELEGTEEQPGWRFVVNGKSVGLDLRDLPSRKAGDLLADCGETLHTVAWSDWDKRLPDLVKALNKQTKGKLILSLELNTTAGAAALGSLGPLAPRIVGLRLAGTAIRPAHLATLPPLPSIRWLDLSHCGQCGLGARHLVRFSSLRSLDLGRANLTDAELASIAALHQLRALNLSGTSVTDAGLAHLKRLRTLRRLAVESTTITNKGLAQISALLGLRALSLSRTRVDAVGLTLIGRLVQLQHLRLRHLPLGKASLAPLAALRELRTLDLTACGLHAAAIAPLATLPRLVSLGLANNPIAGGGAARLRPLTSMIELDLSGTELTPRGLPAIAGMARLRQLDLGHNHLNKADAAILGHFTHLNQLGLARTGLGRVALPHLGALHDLRGLDLDGEVDINDLESLWALKGIRWLGVGYTALGCLGVERLLRLPELRRLDAWKCECQPDLSCGWLEPHPRLQTIIPLRVLNGSRWDAGMGAMFRLPAVPPFRTQPRDPKSAALSLLHCPSGRVKLDRNGAWLFCDHAGKQGNEEDFTMVRVGAQGSFLRPGEREVLVLKNEIGQHSHAEGSVYGVVMRWDGLRWQQHARFPLDSSDAAQVLLTLRRIDGRDLAVICRDWIQGGYARGTCRELDPRRPGRSRWQLATHDDRGSCSQSGTFCVAERALIRDLGWGVAKGVVIQLRTGELKHGGSDPCTVNVIGQRTRAVRLVFDGWHSSLVDAPPCGTDPTHPDIR